MAPRTASPEAPAPRTGLWMPAEVETLRALMATGATFVAIAAALGRTEAAVGNKANKLKRAEERSEVPAGTRPSTRKAVERRVPRRIGVRLPPTVPADPLTVAPGRPIRLLHRPSSACCWPLWGRDKPAPGEHFVCGAAVGTRIGKGGEPVLDSYCPAHAATARGKGTQAEREAA